MNRIESNRVEWNIYGKNITWNGKGDGKRNLGNNKKYIYSNRGVTLFSCSFIRVISERERKN